MNNKGSGLTPAQALDKLDALYEQSVVALRNAIGNYITSGELPDENARKPTDLHKGIAALKAAGITEFSTTELEMIAQSEVELSPEDLEIFEGLVDALEDDDDVQKVYHNVANL